MTAKKKRGRPRKSSGVHAAPVAPETITPHPTAGPQIKDFEKKIDSILNGAAIPQEPAAGPGPGLEKESVLPGRVLAEAIKMPFEIWSLNFDDKKLQNCIRLKDNEADLLAIPVGKLIEHYAPNIPEIVYAWFAFSVTVYSILSYRLRILAEYRKLKNSSSPPGTTGPVIEQKPNAPGRLDLKEKFPKTEEIKPTQI